MIFNFIWLSMLSTFVGFMGLIVVLTCVILFIDLIRIAGDKIEAISRHQEYQGSEDTNE